MIFPIHYKQHVLPKLRREIEREGELVAEGIIGWCQAHQYVMDVARRHGAAYLPPTIFDDLDDWISDTLLARILAAEAPGAA